MPVKPTPIIERPRRRLKVMPSGCWEFEGSRLPFGYGQISNPGGIPKRTHCLMWEIVFGPIPEGLCVLHTCDNPPCCNPAHLFLGTRTDNAADKVAKGRQAKGETLSKLTLEQVKAIRADQRSGYVVAKEYGVNGSTICRIRTGTRWKGD